MARVLMFLAVVLGGCSARGLYICGGAMRGVGASMASDSSAPQRWRSPSAQKETEGGCSSDYACPYGQACIKAPGAFRGYCARPVGAYGEPAAYQPRSDSINAGAQGGCSFDTDCYAGFFCAKQQGQIYGACLRR